MKKKPKQAIGLQEDGLSIKVAHLIRDGRQIYLQSIERIELEKPLYHDLVDPVLTVEENSWESTSTSEEINIDDFESESVTAFKLQPFDGLISGFDFTKTVIALNVSDDNLQVLEDVPSKPAQIRKVIKNIIPKHEFKSGEWQWSQVSRNDQNEVWLHSGTNRLLEMLQDCQRRTKAPFFYQLADSNDIALTDYFRQSLSEDSGKTLLVFLGQEYRKAFLFIDDKWTATYPLQISQHSPDPEVIYSKLSLALDNAQVGDPDSIVICGDYATSDTLEYLLIQFTHSKVKFLQYNSLIINSSLEETFDQRYLVQFALPIALALKALQTDNKVFTKTNFLPSKVIEGQKVFKIAWHGFLILIMIFGTTMYATIGTLTEQAELKTVKSQFKRLEKEVNAKKSAASEIKKIRSDLDAHQSNMQVMRSLLENKNPWTEVLRILINDIANRPITWLTNIRLEKEGLYIGGTTTERRNIVGISRLFPNTRIIKVVHGDIRNKTVWQFEMFCDLPTIDWISTLEADLTKLDDFKEGKTPLPPKTEPVAQSKSTQPPKEEISVAKVPKKTQESEKAPEKAPAPPLYAHLGAIPEGMMIYPSEELVNKADKGEANEYQQFIAATKKGSTWHYRDLGIKFVQKYSQSALQPYVRWHLAHRYYLDKEYIYAMQYLDPLIKAQNDFYPYALVLAARVEFASGNSRYKEHYQTLKKSFASHRLISIVNDDLRQTERKQR